MALLTFGHGTAGRDELLKLLRGAGIEVLVDVRTAPGSRRNPDVARQEMARWLPDHAISYRWERRLGGWRKAPPGSPDTALRNRSFAGYAAHMRTPEFLDAIGDLLDGARDRTTTVFCSESVWWRCHRRIISDYLLAAGESVFHILGAGHIEPAKMNEGARAEGERVTYPALL